MIRVKLPNASAYAGCPSGDSEYEDAYKSAIARVKPEGFEVKWPRIGHRWPVDSEGYTYVPLDCINEDNVMAELIFKVHFLEEKIKKAREALVILS